MSTQQISDTPVRAYIRERKAGWYAVSKWKGLDGAEGTTVVGPMSREDAEAVREGLQRSYEQEAEVSHA